MPIVVTPTAPAQGLESLVLAGTELNDLATFQLEALDLTPPPKRPEWVTGADSDGAALVRDPLVDKRTITAQVRVIQQASMNAALTALGSIVDLLEESERNEGGITLVHTPAGSTHSYTFYVLSGEVTGIPLDQGATYFQRSPQFTIRLDCKPFGYGTEQTAVATVTNTNPVQILTIAGVLGDVPAEGRLIVTDAATQSRRHLEWGLQQRYYDAATSLQINSGSLVTSGFGGSSTTRAGSVNTNVIRSTLTTAAQGVCGTGVLSHVGGFRVKARVFLSTAVATGSTISVRLTWQEGDGPFRSGSWTSAIVTSAASGWYELDLGTIAVPEKAIGTQRWVGKVESCSRTVGDTIDVDYLLLEPTEAYGKARAPAIIETLSAFGARDEFDQTAGNLNGKTLPIGGTWATTGADATDLTVETTGHTVTRATTGDASGKTAIPGTTTYTDVIAQVDFKTTSPVSVQRLIARYVDASNYLKVEWNSLTEFLIQKVVAGVASTIAYKQLTGKVAGTFYSVRVFVAAGGQVGAAFFDQGGQLTSWTMTGSDAALATGGTLASGKVGFMDINSSGVACTRNYDNFWAGAATPQVVIYSGRSAEIRSGSAIRQDSTGTYYGPIPSYRGARFFLPPAGSANRTSRILVKARRNDVDVAADDQPSDSTTVSVSYTPRWISPPR